MSLKKFETNDIFTNRIKTHPRSYFLLNNGVTYYNHDVVPILSGTGSILHAPQGHLSLHELNINRTDTATNLIYPFVTKQGTLESFKTISTEAFQGFSYGDQITGSYPDTATISTDYFAASATRKRIMALKNTFNHYRTLSHHYTFKTSEWDKATQAIRLVSIPSIFYGSSIKKGSLKLNVYDQGDLVATLEDKARNGELVQTLGPNTPSASSTAEITFNNSMTMFYDTKRIVIQNTAGVSKTFIFDDDNTEGTTGTVDGSGNIVVQISSAASLAAIATEFAAAIGTVSGFQITTSDNTAGVIGLTQDIGGTAGDTTIGDPDSIMDLGIVQFSGGANGAANSDIGKVAGVVLYNEGFVALTGSWDIGTGTLAKKWYDWGTAAANPVWDIDFLGTNYIPTITMFAHAKQGELNNSVNPTFIDFSDKNDNQEEVTLSPNKYVEDTELTISNVVKSEHSNTSGSFEKITYISKIGIYDEQKNLIGIAKLATPIKKTESRSYTFKMKLDF